MPIKYFFNFISLSHGRVEITEPQGMDSAQFKIVQEEGRHGRNIVYAGEGSKFRIGRQPNHQLKRILQYNELFGFEAVVHFEVKFDDVLYTIGQVDFNTAQTDNLTYFSFAVKQLGKIQQFELRYDVPTDVLSYNTLDGTYRQPIQLYKVYAPAKPIVQVSEWKAPQAGMFVETESPYTDPLYFNVVSQQVKTGIDDSLSSIFISNNASNGAFKYLTYIRAATRLRDVKVEFRPDALYKYLPTGDIENQKGQIRVFVFWGQSEAIGDYQSILMWESIEFSGTSDQQQVVPPLLTATIPVVNQTDTVWIGFVSANRNASRNRVDFGNPTIKIQATSIAYDSVVSMCRVKDVMTENAARTSDMPVSAPRWDVTAGQPTGEFYNQFMTTPSLMRNLLERPFTITTKEIVEGYLPFCNGDYQLVGESVHYLRYPDFYRNVELGYYPNVLSEDYIFDKDPDARIKAIEVQFSTFESQKENEKANTQDEVHGNGKWLLPNKQTDNTKQIKIDAVMSAFSLENARRKALDIAETAATQDDSKKYVVECVELPLNDPRRIKQQTATLQHEGNGLTLVLTNQGEFSWTLLGIETGDPFTINSNENPGTYPSVLSVTERQLVLQAVGEPLDYPSNNTTFTYRVGSSTTYIWATNEGLEEVQNIEDGENYVNLKYTLTRILRTYYSEYLSTAIYFTRFGSIINTEYNNNPAALTRFEGDFQSIIEGEPFRPNNPILSPWLHEDVRLSMDFEQFQDLQAKIQAERGFIKFTDSNGIDKKIYPSDIAFTLGKEGKKSFAIVRGKERLEQAYVRIFKAGDLFTINETIQESDIKFKIDGYEKITLYNARGKKLLPAVYWNQISINGVMPESIQELQMLLD